MPWSGKAAPFHDLFDDLAVWRCQVRAPRDPCKNGNARCTAFGGRYLVALAVGGVVRTAPHGSFFTFLSGILLMPDL
jgi:hypothetical protein